MASNGEYPSMRPVNVWNPRLAIEKRADGSAVITQQDPLASYPERLSDRIAHWADVAGDRRWMAQRGDDGTWREISYGELLDTMRHIGSFLLDLDLSVESPLIILSGNSLEHAVVALSAQYVGIPTAAITPNYSLMDSSYAKLRSICDQITPGAVFVQDADVFAAAVETVFENSIPMIFGAGTAPGGRLSFRYSDIAAYNATQPATLANQETGPDTIAKFLFTSGTTGSPKPVIQTQRMLCANMEMVRDCYRFVQDEPPIVVDWAPWNHVASGNMVFNLVLYNGGTFYIDEGKPSLAGIKTTIANLSEISPTWYFNIPMGYDLLCDAMEADLEIAAAFFSKLRMMMYAGAGMASHTWQRLTELSQRTLGKQVLLCTGLGSTETTPFVLYCTEPQDGPGNVGVPMRGLTVKLVPTAGKLELRVKGPSVTPGYWRQPEITSTVFDEEGFYNMGDAVRPADPSDWSRGFIFDGRTAENFKLDTGTWIAVGSIRAHLIDAFGGLVSDAAICGENRSELGALLIPSRERLEALVGAESQLSDEELHNHPKVRARISHLLSKQASEATGSSNRIARAIIVKDPLDVSRGEITEKGSLNQKALLANRPDLVDQLYGDGQDVFQP